MQATGRRPLVGVTACIKAVGKHPFHAAGQKYVDAVVIGAKALPVILPALADEAAVDQWLDVLDGVLLTGSASNVAPARYGQAPAREDLLTDPARDASNFPLITRALARGVPLLGICRGLQELNVACGGSLFQAVHEQSGKRDHREPSDAPVEVQYGPAHPVSLSPGGWLSQLLGGQGTLTVNSIHGQGIDRLGQGLVVEAVAEDGLVEAIRVAQAPGFAFAVQWHPEWKIAENPDSLAILGAFGQACAERSENRR